MGIIGFKATKCKYCYKCVRNCEVKAIMIKDGRAEIMPDKCVLYGKCLRICPQSAKTLVSDPDMVRRYIKSGETVVVSLAPSYMGFLKYKTIGQMQSALLKLDFADVRETSKGAVLVMEEYTRLLRETKMENIVTTCCPSVNDLIEIYYPQLVPYLAPVVSPMVAHGKLLKKGYGRDARVVFIRPCIAKKKESQDRRHDDRIDVVLNFNDLRQWLREEEIEIEDCEDMPFEKADPKMSRLYPVTNGAVNSVLATEGRADDYRKLYTHGIRNCIGLCDSMSRGEISGCFIEMNMYSDGYIKGPTVEDETISGFKVKLSMEKTIAKESIQAKTMVAMEEGLVLHKDYIDRSPDDVMPTEEEIQAILKKIGKVRPEDELNCGACGYTTCREKVMAVLQKKAEINMCIPYMYDKAESLANLVMETSPNMVLIVDKNMKIMEYSATGEKYFGKTRVEALEMYLYELIDPADSQWVYDSHQNIHGKKITYSEHNLSTLQNVVYVEQQDVALATFIDITKEEEQTKQEYEKKLETIDLAQKVIHKQMMMAQEIAGLLGETTADTKTTLTKLCRLLLEDVPESEVE